jgi:hypothetical protein
MQWKENRSIFFYTIFYVFNIITGCWDVREASKEWFKFLDNTDENVDFQLPYSFTEGLLKNALDENITRETLEFWVKVSVLG